MKFYVLCLVGFLAVLASCASGPTLRVESPSAPGSAEPNLTLGRDGTLYLSWIETSGEDHLLRFSSWQGDAWAPARTIAAGQDWFVNWADFPSVAASGDGTLAAHWLVRNGPGTFAYSVQLAISRDGGNEWSDPVAPHRDETETEHGFVSIVPLPDGTFEVVWLDGREMQVIGDAAHGTGLMTLRSARLDENGDVTEEKLIDSRVCDCCSTDAVLAADGSVVVAYRDRSESEIRDISASRLEAEGWTAEKPVHQDGWKIAGCPVNGPAMAAAGDRLVVAWFTAPAEKGVVNVAFSGDGGRTFGEPLRMDGGKAIGRVDVVLLEGGTAVVSWLERGALQLRWVDASGPLSAPLTAAPADESRAGGFPQLALLGDSLFLAWTEPGDPSRVRTATLPSRVPGS